MTEFVSMGTGLGRARRAKTVRVPSEAMVFDLTTHNPKVARSNLKALEVISKSVDPPKYKVRFRGKCGTVAHYCIFT